MTDVVRPTSASARARRRAHAEPIPYDFRRPIQLSREHARTLQVGLDAFGRQATTVFTSNLRRVCSFTLASIDQRSYAEYIDGLDASTYMTIFTSETMPGASILEIPLQVTLLCIDHMLGGPGGNRQPERPLTEIESTVMGSFVERLLHEFRYSLEGAVPWEPEIRGIEYSPQFAQVAGPADVMVVVNFDLKIGEAVPRRLTLCLPFNGLHPHLQRAAAPAPVSAREVAQREEAALKVKEQFDHVAVEVCVRLRHTEVRPEEISHLKVGDVVRLAHPSVAPLEVSVDDIVFAYATHGAKGTRLAAQIVSAPVKETR